MPDYVDVVVVGAGLSGLQAACSVHAAGFSVLVLEAKGLIFLKGEFSVHEKKLSGEFELGLSTKIVDKFPGAREEVFKREAEGYAWTELSLNGTTDNIRDNLRPRLVRAAQNHFAKGLLAPLFKPGQSVIQAIEAL